MVVKHRAAKPVADPNPPKKEEQKSGSTLYLIFCVLGIYASFLSWAVLQERISTTPYGPDLRVFRSSYTITLVQSLFAFIAGYFFLKLKTGGRIWPSDPKILKDYGIIALCHSFSTPLSFSSLRYVDYVTMLLAKSCKLLPVMAVHLTLYRKKFPTYKYVVVMLVTAGVSLFSLYQSSSSQKSQTKEPIDASSKIYGFLLLGMSLFLDGLYNTTQDNMFHKYGPSKQVSGPQMMTVMNCFTGVYALLSLLVSKAYMEETLWFLKNHPVVFRDIALFGACGALGQIFIFLTLEQFGSLVLVTTTVTRKMISMLLSVVMFNHKLSSMQWVGVGLVFGGIAGETLYKLMK